MRTDFDALVIGGGPAGSAVAIGLSGAGWRVCVVEQQEFPRRKVCGESLAPAGVELLDALGVGAAFRRAAGPELDQVGWMGAGAAVVAPFPRCDDGPYRYGRALGREVLDALLLGRARRLGARILQPARVRTVAGGPGSYECRVERLEAGGAPPGQRRRQAATERFTARVVVAAHGSWGAEPAAGGLPTPRRRVLRARASDLLAFKANFSGAALVPGLLAVLSFEGGYGGIVVADQGCTTLACCIRRDALARCRAEAPGRNAGVAVERLLFESCPGVRSALAGAVRTGAWLAVGPIRPGVRLHGADSIAEPDLFRVGNAAGESHPLIGEGITMALQSAVLLTRRLTAVSPRSLDAVRAGRLRAEYAAAWHAAFRVRMRMARLYAQVAMRPGSSAVANTLLRHRPGLLGTAAKWAGKTRRALAPLSILEEPA